MTVAIGDIIQFDLVGNYNNLVETHNVFHYEVAVAQATGTTFTWLDDASKTWANAVLDNILTVLGAAMSFTAIKAKVIFGADEGIQNVSILNPVTYVGEVGAELLPPFATWTFRKQGAGGLDRNGYQHYSGIPESAQVDGVANGGFLDELAGIAAELGAQKTVFEGGDDGEASNGAIKPVIVKKQANGSNPSGIEVLRKWYPVGVAYAKIGTVNSRKFGIGS